MVIEAGWSGPPRWEGDATLAVHRAGAPCLAIKNMEALRVHSRFRF